MSGYNVVRNSGVGGGEGLPDVLDAVFDGELDLSDSRVADVLSADPAAARRFRETQRVVDRLARRPLVPDLSASILAAVHSQKPFAATPRKSRSRLSPSRLAFAGGLLAGIVLVVVLQSIARSPGTDYQPTVREREVAAISDVVIHPVQPVAITSEPFASDAAPMKPLRRPLGMGKSAKYEAIVTSDTSAAHSGVRIAGFASDIGLDGESSGTYQLATSILSDPCAEPNSDLALAGIAPVQPWTAISPNSGMLLTPTQTNAAYEPSAEWPPADINAFIDHLSECGVSDELRTVSRTK